MQSIGIWRLYNGGLTNGPAIVTGVWHHFALVRSGTTISLYIDGASALSYTDSSTTLYSLQSSSFGYSPSLGDYFSGFMTEIRWSPGIARWTTTFIPPQASYA